MPRSGRRTPPLLLAQRMANGNAEGDTNFMAQLTQCLQAGGYVGGAEMVEKLQQEVMDLQRDMEILQGQLLNMKADVSNVKGEVKDMYEDQKSHDQDKTNMKQDIVELKQKVEQVLTLLEEWKQYGDAYVTEDYGGDDRKRGRLASKDSNEEEWPLDLLASGGAVNTMLPAKVPSIPTQAADQANCGDSMYAPPGGSPRQDNLLYENNVMDDKIPGGSPRQDNPQTVETETFEDQYAAQGGWTSNRTDSKSESEIIQSEVMMQGPMTAHTIRALEECGAVFLKNLELNLLFPYLYEYCVLTVEDIEKIDACHTSTERNRLFLKHILPRKKEKAFWDFRKALIDSNFRGNPDKSFLVEALDGKIECVIGKLTVEIDEAISQQRAVPAPTQVQDELHHNLLELCKSLSDKLTYLNLCVENVYAGSIIIDLSFWKVEQLDNFWAWVHSRQPTPLSEALSEVILTDDIRAMVPEQNLALSLRTVMNWDAYMVARRRLLGNAMPRVVKDDSAIVDGRRSDKTRATTSNSPYHLLVKDANVHLGERTAKDLARMAFEEGYQDKIPILQEKLPEELGDFSAKDIRLERLRDLVRIVTLQKDRMKTRLDHMTTVVPCDQEDLANQLLERSQRVESLQQQVEDLSAEIRLRDEEINHLRYDASKETDEKREINELSTENVRLKEGFQEKCNIINRMKSECKDLHDQMRTKDCEILEKNETINSLEVSVSKMKSTISDLEEQVRSKTEDIKRLGEEKEKEMLTGMAYQTAVEDIEGREALSEEKKKKYLNCGKTIKALQEEIEQQRELLEGILQCPSKINLDDEHVRKITEHLNNKSGNEARGVTIAAEKPIQCAASYPGVQTTEMDLSNQYPHPKDSETAPPAVAKDTAAGETVRNTELHGKEEEGTKESKAVSTRENIGRGGLFKRKSNGLDTVFCIDTSGSMAGEPFQQMKTAMYKILDEMERSHLLYEELEEDVAIVTFGLHGDNTLLSLSNDYKAARRVLDLLEPEGMSPMSRGLVEAQNELQRHGGGLRVSGRRVRPRILVFTDGIPSDSDTEFGSTDLAVPSVSGKYKAMSALQLYKGNTKVSNKAKISFITCGSKADRDFLEPAARIVDGSYFAASSMEDMHGLGAYYRRTVLACRFAAPFKTADSMHQLCLSEFQTFKHWFLATNSFQLAEEDRSDSELREIHNMLLGMTDEERHRPQESEGESDPALQVSLPIGTRVVRGPDWKWQNQDGDGPGTVIDYGKGSWVKVHWDNTDHRNLYRYGGAEDAYDVWQCGEPKKLEDGKLIDVGVKVVRGQDWKYGDQDGGPGNVGVVSKVEGNGKVKVKWPNGKRCIYNFGHDGKFDIAIFEENRDVVGASGSEWGEEDGVKVVWQWKSNDTWVMYPEYISRKLEQAYKNDNRGCYSTEVSSLSRRIDFPSMTDHCADINETYEVQRLVMTQAEYEAARH